MNADGTVIALEKMAITVPDPANIGVAAIKSKTNPTAGPNIPKHFTAVARQTPGLSTGLSIYSNLHCFNPGPIRT